jgi:ribosome assembly protein 1
VLNKRKGRILSEEMHAGTAFFHIAARIPVIESFGVSEELWKRTSGDVRVELVFVGFEVGSGGDPLWVPTTEEELEAVGRSGERVNVAGRMVEGVRKRKGLKRGDVLVRDAEKQRTHKSK